MPVANTSRQVDIRDSEFGLVVIGNGATWTQIRSRVYGIEYSLAVLFTCNFGSMVKNMLKLLATCLKGLDPCVYGMRPLASSWQRPIVSGPVSLISHSCRNFFFFDGLFTASHADD